MGFIREPHGNITIEQRRESFLIHDENAPDWPSPEFLNSDLKNLIGALIEYDEDLDGK